MKAYKDSAGRRDYAIWDENLPGFEFRVQAAGSKVYSDQRRGVSYRNLAMARGFARLIQPSRPVENICETAVTYH